MPSIQKTARACPGAPQLEHAFIQGADNGLDTDGLLPERIAHRFRYLGDRQIRRVEEQYLHISARRQLASAVGANGHQHHRACQSTGKLGHERIDAISALVCGVETAGAQVFCCTAAARRNCSAIQTVWALLLRIGALCDGANQPKSQTSLEREAEPGYFAAAIASVYSLRIWSPALFFQSLTSWS